MSTGFATVAGSPLGGEPSMLTRKQAWRYDALRFVTRGDDEPRVGSACKMNPDSTTAHRRGVSPPTRILHGHRVPRKGRRRGTRRHRRLPPTSSRAREMRWRRRSARCSSGETGNRLAAATNEAATSNESAAPGRNARTAARESLSAHQRFILRQSEIHARNAAAKPELDAQMKKLVSEHDAHNLTRKLARDRLAVLLSCGPVGFSEAQGPATTSNRHGKFCS
jgi:hypothetical protein